MAIMVHFKKSEKIFPRMFLTILTAVFCLPVPVLGNGFSPPDIRECGAIATNRSCPAYELRNTRLTWNTNGPDGTYNSIITLVLKGYGETILQTYFGTPSAEADWDEKAKVDWDHVSGRRVALGWLKGATNLLLVSWRDVSGSHGTGHYVDQHYQVIRVLPGKCLPLLTTRVLSSGNSRHVSQGYGIGQHFFAFDSKTQILTNRATYSRDLYVRESQNIPPLHHRATEGDAAATEQYVAGLREMVVSRYHCEHERLTRIGVELFYRSQGDYFDDIARFYLGPLAPASVLLKANPGLEGTVKDRSDSVIGHTLIPAETLVKIPVPEEWIVNFYR